MDGSDLNDGSEKNKNTKTRTSSDVQRRCGLYHDTEWTDDAGMNVFVTLSVFCFCMQLKAE